VCVFAVRIFAHETAGAVRTRSSLRPLGLEGIVLAKLGRIAPRGRGGVPRLAGRNISALAKPAPTGEKMAGIKKRQRRSI
jgi:hypothetical protein